MNAKAIRKQLAAAVVMVVLAALALGTATYAWFVQNNTVTAQGMEVKAQAESGIVIKAVSDSSATWQTTADAKMDGTVALYPTSTDDLTNWWHAVSTARNDEQSQQAAANYTKVADADLAKYRHIESFKIRAAGAADLTSDIAVDSITATKVTTTSENLDNSIRIGVKIGSTFYVYAPLADATSPVSEGAFTLVAKYDSNKTLTENTAATADDADVFGVTTIPAADNTAIQADVYMWFEGEDGNCMSDNITTTLDNITVSIVFKSVTA